MCVCVCVKRAERFPRLHPRTRAWCIMQQSAPPGPPTSALRADATCSHNNIFAFSRHTA